MATWGGFGGLGGIDLGDALGALGSSLLTSPRIAPLAGLPAAIATANRAAEKDQSDGALALALVKNGVDPQTAMALAKNQVAASLFIAQQNQAKKFAFADKIAPLLGLGGSAPGGGGSGTGAGVGPQADATDPDTAPATAAAPPATTIGGFGGLGGIPAPNGGRLAVRPPTASDYRDVPPGFDAGPAAPPVQLAAATPPLPPPRPATVSSPIVGGGGSPPPAITTDADSGLPTGQVAAAGSKITPAMLPKLVAPSPQPKFGDDTTTARALARRDAAAAMQALVYASAMGEDGKLWIEPAKAKLAAAQKLLDPTDMEKAVIAAGIEPRSPQGRALLLAAADKRPEPIRLAEFANPGQPNLQRQAVARGMADNRTELEKIGEVTQDRPGVVAAGIKTKADLQGAEKAATLDAEATSAAKTGAPYSIDQARQALSLIKRIKRHPSLYWATSGTAWVPDIAGGERREFATMFDQLKGQAFQNAYQSLRGGGAITEKEGEKGTAAYARLDRGLSTAAFRTALDDMRDTLKAGIERAEKSSAGTRGPAGAALPPSLAELEAEAKRRGLGR